MTLIQWCACAVALSCLTIAPARHAYAAETILLNDPLNGTTQGVRTGGAFTGGGWAATDLASTIMFDAGEPVDCGWLEVQVKNFNPPGEYHHYSDPKDCTQEECCVFFLSGYEGSGGSIWDAAKNFETMFWLQASAEGTALRDNAIIGRMDTVGWDFQPPEEYGLFWFSGQYAWDTGHTYTLRVAWDGAALALSIDGTPEGGGDWKWPPTLADPTPNLRYFFIGSDNSPGTGWLEGPVYANVRIAKVEPCGDPCAGHCTDGTQNCGETGVDCGGECGACPGPDGGAQDDAGGDAGAGPDTGPPADAGAEDTGHPTDTGGPHDAGGTRDTGTGADAGTTTDGGTTGGPDGGPGQESAGCACAAIGI